MYKCQIEAKVLNHLHPPFSFNAQVQYASAAAA